MLGTGLIDLWKKTGDVIRDMGSLFQEVGLDYTDTEVGAWGSVHLYVAFKLDARSSVAATSPGR